MAGVTAGAAAGQVIGDGDALYALAASALLAGVGFAGVLRGLNTELRFCLQVLIAVALTWALVRPTTAPQAVTVLLGGVWIVAFTNAFNFMDGINGISALYAAVATAWFAWLAWEVGQLGTMRLAIVLLAALPAFIPWNCPTARVFLGDVGSYAIGGALAGMAVVLFRAGAPLLACLAPLLTYVLDTGLALHRRIAGKRPWREAHREHVYQRVVDSGLSQSLIAPAIAVFSSAVCASWYLLHHVSSAATVVVMLALCGCYLVTPILASMRTIA